MGDHKNTVLAIVLSALVLIGWQYFVGMPQLEKQKREQIAQQQAQQGPKPAAGQPSQPGTPSASPGTPGSAPPSVEQRTPGAPGQIVTRDAAISASPRIVIDTPNLTGSINRKGGRIDDIKLVRFRETVDPNSPPIVLLSPSGSPEPFYAEFGWIGTATSNCRTPTRCGRRRAPAR